MRKEFLVWLRGVSCKDAVSSCNEYLLMRGFSGGVSREVSCEVSCEGSLARSLFFQEEGVSREKGAVRPALWQVSMLLLSVTGEDWSFVVTGKR